MAKGKKYLVYVLTNNSTPIYVGCTSRIETRLQAHIKLGKRFNGHVIIDAFKNKKDAFAAEAAIIKYLSVFANPENVNAKYTTLKNRALYLKTADNG